jgi:hypothetical protein
VLLDLVLEQVDAVEWVSDNAREEIPRPGDEPDWLPGDRDCGCRQGALTASIVDTSTCTIPAIARLRLMSFVKCHSMMLRCSRMGSDKICQLGTNS